MRGRRAYLRSVAAVAATAALAGCTGSGGNGGGAYGGGNATPTPTAAAETTAESGGTGAQSEYPDYNWRQLEGVEPTATATVTMSNFAFEPLVARMPPGTTVSFLNEDSTSHTVTIPALGVDRQVSGGGETSVTVEESGTYDYVCTFHGPDMLGRLVVEEGVTVGGDGGSTETPTDGGGYDGGGY